MPLQSLKYLSPHIQVAVWHITEPAEELRSLLSFPNLFADKIANLRPDSRRLKEVLAVRCLLKQLTGQEHHILYKEDGSPYLADASMQLSITHTDGYAAVILADDAALSLGIDIEKIGHRVERVVDRFLQPYEITLLADIESSLFERLKIQSSSDFVSEYGKAHYSPLSLHLAWSAKETAFKVLGASFYDLQSKTRITEVSVEEHLINLSVEGRGEPLYIHYELTEAYAFTYCYQKL